MKRREEVRPRLPLGRGPNGSDGSWQMESAGGRAQMARGPSIIHHPLSIIHDLTFLPTYAKRDRLGTGAFLFCVGGSSLGVYVDLFTDFVVSFWNLTADMSLYLLLGFVMAGFLKVLVPEGWVYRQLGQSSLLSVFKAALLGAPLPLCSCGVLPVAAQLKAGGASRPALLTFLVSTPVTGVDSILATYALLGGFMAVVRPVASVIVAVAGGIALLVWTKGRRETKPREVRLPPGLPRYSIRSLRMRRLWDGLEFAFTDLMAGMARPMLAGLLLGAAISVWLPPTLISDYLNKGPLPYLVVVALGIPLYVCSTGSIPIAAALMLKGLSPGAALAFMIAGPATNTVALAVARDLIGKKGFWIYVVVVAVGAVGTGMLTDVLAGALQVTPPMQQVGIEHQSAVWSALGMVAAGILLFLLAYRGIAVPLFHRIRAREPALRKSSGFPTVVLKVPEAECSRCSATITATLQHLDEVRTVEVDLDRRLVTVELRARFQSAALVRALAKAGYESRIVAE